MFRQKPLPILLLSLVAAALLAGCGSSSSSSSENGLAQKSPEQILQAAKQAAHEASTVRVKGSIANEGKALAIDLSLEKGKGATGSLTIEGSRVEIVDLENSIYIKGSPAFYSKIAGPSAAQLLAGKWLKAPASSGSFSSFSQLGNLEKLIDSVLSEHGTLKNSGTKTVQGKKAVGVTDTQKNGTLYVSLEGKAYPLEIGKSGAGGGSIVFEQWNQPVTITAPANAVNIGQLQSGG